MATIYIVSNNGKLSKRGDSLVFTDYDNTKTILHPHTLTQLFVVGSMELTGQALQILMKYMIETVFVSKNGKYDGKLVFQDSKNVFLRQKQYNLLQDEEFCFKFAKSVISGKLKNQYLFMQRIFRKGNTQHDAVRKRINDMSRNIAKLENVQTIEELRGLEGYGASCYFSVFKNNIIQDWAVFNGRSKNPPKDNVNAVLSFLYTLLAYRIDSLIVSEGLDNAVGILHNMSYGRKSLVFDLMEEFRTPLVDTLTCALFNMAVLKQEDFRTVCMDNQVDSIESEPESPESIDVPGEYTKAVLLTKEGLRKVVAKFEKKLQDEHLYEPAGKRINYKRMMHEQVKMYKRLVLGLEETYKPVVIT